MDFARREMEKCGWTEGKGLGKNEDGISSAIKPTLKFDRHGFGHDVGEEFTNKWWDILFNKAAKKITVEVGNNTGVTMKTRNNEFLSFSCKNNNSNTYKDFINAGAFNRGDSVHPSGGDSIYHTQKLAKVSGSSFGYRAVTDEELFVACGGRTAHKGARHGLNLSGKLSRIEKQEKMLLKKMKKISLSDKDKNDSKAEKKFKKLKKQKENNEKIATVAHSTEKISIVKKKKKPKKSVSFNETVTKIYPSDLEASFDSEINSMRDESSNEPNLASGSDEGIGLENVTQNRTDADNHKSFETFQCKYSDLSKAERKKLRKKRKLEEKLNTSTNVFLLTLKPKYNKDSNTDDLGDRGKNLKKRKYLDEPEQLDPKQSCVCINQSSDQHRIKRNKKKRKKERKMEEKQMNNMVKSLNSCSL